jgi:hypothetical protein
LSVSRLLEHRPEHAAATNSTRIVTSRLRSSRTTARPEQRAKNTIVIRAAHAERFAEPLGRDAQDAGSRRAPELAWPRLTRDIRSQPPPRVRFVGSCG